MLPRKLFHTILDDEVSLIDVPNQGEMNAVAKALEHESTRRDVTRTACQRREALLRRLEALHDTPANEIAILFNILHRPLEKFLRLPYIKEDKASVDVQSRGERLLSVWRESLDRRKKSGATPSPLKNASPTTSAKKLFLPREISESPEPEVSDSIPLDLNFTRKSRSSTTVSQLHRGRSNGQRWRSSGRDLSLASQTPCMVHNTSEWAGIDQRLHEADSDQSRIMPALPTPSPESRDTSPTTSAPSDKIVNISLTERYNPRSDGRYEDATNSTVRPLKPVASTPRVPRKRAHGESGSRSAIVVRRSRDSPLDSTSSKRIKQQTESMSFRTALKECQTNQDVQNLVIERVGSPADDSKYSRPLYSIETNDCSRDI